MYYNLMSSEFKAFSNGMIIYNRGERVLLQGESFRKMEAKIVTTEELKTYKGELSEDLAVTYIKLIGFGKEFLSKVKSNGEVLENNIEKSNGFVLLCQGEDLRQELHSIVDRFCNSKEEIDNE